MAGNCDLRFGIIAVLASLYLGTALQAQQPDQTKTGVVHANEGIETETQQVKFSFVGAKWHTVPRWFANAAHMNLDWQELPDDELNLITQGSYSIPEAHNVINMHLLSRGFTLVNRDGVLFLVKLGESLNPTMVPRIKANDLDTRPSYEYVKVSLPLDWMVAEEAAKELAPTLSPFGKIIPLTATNRIEAMDAVANLRELRDLLMVEQSGNSQERLVAEFVLDHASATDVISKLRDLLGLEQRLDRMSRDQMRTVREQYEFRAELAKRLGDKAPPIRSGHSDVFLVANERKNSISANAPPDKIAVIRQAVLALDVPTNEMGMRLSEITTMKVYPLNGAEADAVSDLLSDLREIGELHPNARFSEDDDREILFAYASLKDHVTIRSVMDQLAGSARTFQVIPLRRLKATYVAQSIQSLMGGEQISGGGDDRRRRSRTAGSSWRGFRVEADPPHNRLFLFAREAESKQVQELLVRIGERAAADGKVRVLNAPAESVDQIIDRLQRIWPSMSSNPLQINLRGRGQEGGAERQPTRLDQRIPSKDEANSRALPGKRKRNKDLGAKRGRAFVSLNADPSESAKQFGGPTEWPDEPQRGALFEFRNRKDLQSPVTITESNDGELILSSDDSAALNQLEQALLELMPQQKPYTLFRLSHASPFSLQLRLEEIFATSGVEATMPLKFVSDENTKSIMVFGADKSELGQIQDYIDVYDQAQTPDPDLARRPRFFRLRYAKAVIVASVIKDIYRDVLSPYDREMRRPNDKDAERAPIVVAVADADEKQPQFKGMLSVGVFPDTNTIVVSAPEYLSREIASTIEGLDRPDASTVTSVLKLSGRTNSGVIARQLSNLVSPTTRPASQARSSGEQRSSSEERSTEERQTRTSRRRN